ncbi:MAG: FAD-dependent oxidoreductase [Clostridia bacterium]|nr:FAD-dependent oxidoreductase [Clostridia bacterium]
MTRKQKGDDHPKEDERVTTIREEARDLPLRGRYDVIVCGGGVAGIAAALASARCGAKTLLIEREYALGGLATLGLITIYLPLCDGLGRQCSFGIAEELLRLSISRGAEDLYPDAWLDGVDPEARKKQRFQVRFSANVFALLCEEKLRDAGVETLFGVSVCGGALKGGRVTRLVCEGRDGRFWLACGSAVDATGDAVLCRALGLDCAPYRWGNTLPSWYYYLRDGRLHLQMLGYAENPNQPDPDDETNPAVDMSQPHFGGLDSFEVSRMTEAAHRQLLDHFFARGDVSDGYALTAIPTVPQLRMTARLVGEATPDVADAHVYVPESIGLISDWRRAGPVYEIPYGSLYCGRVDNLWAAGRMISVSDRLWDVSRVIPACAVTGQAAGTAAALSRGGERPDYMILADRLRADGVILHERDLP